MATLPSYFDQFIRGIRMTENQIQGCINGHSTLRSRLKNDEDLKPIIVDTFLQGSYRRATATRPLGDARSDVDVIVVTKMNRNDVSPSEALDAFIPFLDKHYRGRYERQGRSWGIKLTYVELDLVPTSAPSEAEEGILKSASVLTERDIVTASQEGWRPTLIWLPSEERPGTDSLWLQKNARAEEWKSEPLWIPDRDADEWEETDPLTQIVVTQEKNAACNGHFVNVVKALKWWRKAMQPEPKYPKGYPLEHLAWVNCPDGIDSIAAGVVNTFEKIRDDYAGYAATEITPFVADHGVPTHNVLQRVSGSDFAAFHALVSTAASQAREAVDEDDVCESAEIWRALFGPKFPQCPNRSKKGGYTPRKEASIVTGGRFA